MIFTSAAHSPMPAAIPAPIMLRSCREPIGWLWAQESRFLRVLVIVAMRNLCRHWWPVARTCLLAGRSPLRAAIPTLTVLQFGTARAGKLWAEDLLRPSMVRIMITTERRYLRFLRLLSMATGCLWAATSPMFSMVRTLWLQTTLLWLPGA